MKRKLCSVLSALAVLASAAAVPVGALADSDEPPSVIGFNLTQSDSSLWNARGWSGTNAVKDGTVSVTNGWAHYAGAVASDEAFSFTFNTSAASGALQIYFRNCVSEDTLLSGDNTAASQGNPFMLTYSAKSGQIYFSEYTGKTVTQLRNKADTAASGGVCESLNDGNDHIITVVTEETDITELKLYADGVYLFSSYWHGGVKQPGYISFVTYAQNTFNISALYIDGVNCDPYALGKDTEYVSFGFESGVTASYPNGASDAVYAEGISEAAHSGNTGLHIVKQAGAGCWFYVALSDADTAALKSGKTYRASMYIKTNPNAAASGQTTFNFYSGAYAGSTSFKNKVTSDVVSNWGIDKGWGDYLDKAKDASDNGWTKLMVSSEFTVADGYPYIVLVIWAEDKTAFDWYIDDIEFCEITQVSVKQSDTAGGSFAVKKSDNIYSLGLGAEGEIEVTEGDFAYGDTVMLTAASEDGYTLEGWYLNGEKVIGAGNAYSFKLTANTEITARFEQGCNLIGMPSENWSLDADASLADTLDISSGGSARLNSLLLRYHTLKIRFISGAAVFKTVLSGNNTQYGVIIADGIVSLKKYTDSTEETLASSEVRLDENRAEYELYISISKADNGINITVTMYGSVLIDYTDTSVQDFYGLFTACGSDIRYTYIGVEGLINTEFERLSCLKRKIDSLVALNIGSTLLDDLNTEYGALDESLIKMLPNTEILKKANDVYNEFVSAGLSDKGAVSAGGFCGIEQRSGGALSFSFKTDREKHRKFIENGFKRLQNGAVILPSALLNGGPLYADTARAETVVFDDNGTDISRYSVLLSGWDSRQRRNTELSFRGYSVYEKDGIRLIIYSDTLETSVYKAAVNQYNIITLDNMEISVFNGERALLYLSGDTENQVIDISLTDIKQNIKTLGRTSYSDTALLVDRALAGFAVSGYFKGDVCVDVDINLNKVSCMYAYSVTDGDYENAVRITMNSSGEYVIASFAEAGEHTIELIKATEGGLAKLDIKSLGVTGSLNSAPAQKQLSLEFLGDSITSGWGIYTYDELGTDDQSVVSDTFLNYASRTARALNAEVSVISRSGIRTEQLFEEQYPYIHNRSKELWSYTSHPDIIVVNLGQNDTGTYADNQAAFAEMVTERLEYLRRLHPNAAIIWVNGMMSTTLMPAIAQAVTDFDDPLVFSLCLPTNTDGQYSHPSVSGHINAAAVLTEYISKTVIPVLTK